MKRSGMVSISFQFFFRFCLALVVNDNVCRFIEEDFDAYIKRIKQPYVWGGELELLMASHFLR